MSEWKEYKVEDIISEISMGPFGSDVKKEVYTSFGIPILNGANLQGFKLKEDSFGYVSEEKANSLKKCNAYRGDIVVTHRGTLGQIVYIPNNSKFDRYVISQSQFRFTCNNDIVRPDFLVYLFHTKEGQHKILSNASQVGVPALARATTTFRQIKVKIPSLSVQTKITNILSSLDDKIEVNRRINEQLEELAGALFKSWFVDFEPFKDGEFVDSELGMIPKGWKVGTFSNVVDSTLGGDWGKENEQGNYTKEVFCIRGADIPEIKIGNRGKMPIRYILEKNFAKKSLANNDLVVEISGGSPTQSTGRVCRVTSELLEKYNNSLICTNFCRAIKPFADYSAYIYYYWQYLYDQGTMFNYENGTTGIKNLMINDILDKEPIVIPPINIVEQYKDVVETFATKIQKNGEEIEKLTTLRDTLLPKLMSGEIDVNEVEI